MPETNIPWLIWLGQALLESVWQMGLCWLIYRLAVRLLPAGASAARHQLAVGLLGAGFTWFWVTLFRGTSATSLVTPSAVFISGPGHSFPLHTLYYGLALLYLLLLLFHISTFLRQYRQVYKLEEEAGGKLPVEWRLYIQRMSALLGIRRRVNCRISNQLSSPATVGWWKPVILLPVAALTRLTPGQVESLLLHELVHIRRYDYLVNWLVQAVRTLLYFNPFVRLFVRTIELERELSCDQWVLQFRYDPARYAEALLQLQCEAPRLALAAGGKSHLLFRVERILGIRPKTASPWRIAGQGLLVLLLLLALPWINLPSVPSLRSAFTPLPAGVEWMKQDIAPAASIPVATAGKPLSSSISYQPGQPDEIDREEPGPEGPIPVIQAQSVLLSAEQEAQVQKAIRESQQLVQSKAWKVWEKQIAEVLTEREKAGIREELARQLDKEAWQVWENRLRQGYSRLNWEEINQNLENALADLRSDSLRQHYQDMLHELARIEQALRTDSLRGLPDSDITLEKLQQWTDSLRRKADQLIQSKKSRQL